MVDENRNVEEGVAGEALSKGRRSKFTTEEYFAAELETHRKYLLEFHVQLCPCKRPECLHAHSASEQRRVPELLPSSKWNYFPHKCKQGLSCSKLLCSKAHNDDEVKFHPTVYKTKRCSFDLAENGTCLGFGLHCPFAHSDEDIRTGSRPPDDGAEEESEGQGVVHQRKRSPKSSAPPFRSITANIAKLQLRSEIDRLKSLLQCALCGEFEKEWLLECGHMVCSLCCNGRLRECPSCGSEVRSLRAVPLK